LKDGWIVQSKGFSRYQNVGNPLASVKMLSEWGFDEVIYLDISKGEQYDIRREDQGYKNRNNIVDILDDVSKVTFMPITVGGKIRTLDDIEKRLSLGADKVAINKIAVESPLFVNSVAKEFGSQCVVVSLDVRKIGNEYLI
jgi:cyclase